MATTLTITPAGIEVEITDAKGEVVPYRVSVLSPFIDFTFTRLDNGKVYFVTDANSFWSCDCPDFEFRGFRKRGEVACKHCLKAVELQGDLRDMLKSLCPSG